MADLIRRAATLNDMKGIWTLVRQVAADFPVDLSTDAGQENVLTEIMIGCTSELSPVVVAKDKAIVGALLARRDEYEWGLSNGNVIHVTCAAIAPSHKDQGLLQSLFTELQEQKLPIHVSVKSGNQLGLADELKKLGFEHAITAADGWGEIYAWQAPAPAAEAAAPTPEASSAAPASATAASAAAPAPAANSAAPVAAASSAAPKAVITTLPGLTQRAATLNDMKSIWSLVREVAADFPVDLTSDDGQENMLTEIMIGCTSELSPVVVTKDKTVVGALLARRDENEWGLWNRNVIHVTCAAIAPSHKDQGLLQPMFAALQEKKLPIHVSVKSGNQLGLADELKKLGFEPAITAPDGWGELYTWDPPAAAANGTAVAA